MDKVSKRQSAVLEVLDEQIEELEEKLAKVQPLLNELNRLKQTRRVLLSEKSTTGGGGNPNVQITQEEVIRFLRENGTSKPQQIAEGLGVEGTVVRSHLQRHKDTTYERDDESGEWGLIEGGEEDE